MALSGKRGSQTCHLSSSSFWTLHREEKLGEDGEKRREGGKLGERGATCISHIVAFTTL